MLKFLLVIAFIFSNLLQTANAGSERLPVIKLNVLDYTIIAEVANTPSARAIGLMHRTDLPENNGMLFVFPVAGIYGMWMQNTHLPLSVAFLNEMGVIINIANMIPHTITSHRPVKAAKYALEMNLGWFDARGIKAGEVVLGIENINNVGQPESKLIH
jgi:uncharacterized protein